MIILVIIDRQQAIWCALLHTQSNIYAWEIILRDLTLNLYGSDYKIKPMVTDAVAPKFKAACSIIKMLLTEWIKVTNNLRLWMKWSIYVRVRYGLSVLWMVYHQNTKGE